MLTWQSGGSGGHSTCVFTQFSRFLFVQIDQVVKGFEKKKEYITALLAEYEE